MAQTISTRQIKAARALLAWSQEELAKRSGVSYPTIARLEADDGQLGGRSDTGDKITNALICAGVIFVAENGDGPGVRLRKRHEDRNNLDQHIHRLEGEVTHLKEAAIGKPSPEKGMAMLRRGRAKSDLAKAKNKRAKASK
jgi:transcriptional regulator with XRE-family HTH domain